MEWEAEFEMDGINYSANFSDNGDWQEIEYTIKKEVIPTNVLQTLKSKYEIFEMEAADISITNEGAKYEFL